VPFVSVQAINRNLMHQTLLPIYKKLMLVDLMEVEFTLDFLYTPLLLSQPAQQGWLRSVAFVFWTLSEFLAGFYLISKWPALVLMFFLLDWSTSNLDW
jgi:hypothetical protein